MRRCRRIDPLTRVRCHGRISKRGGRLCPNHRKPPSKRKVIRGRFCVTKPKEVEPFSEAY